MRRIPSQHRSHISYKLIFPESERAFRDLDALKKVIFEIAINFENPPSIGIIRNNSEIIRKKVTLSMLDDLEHAIQSLLRDNPEPNEENLPRQLDPQQKTLQVKANLMAAGKLEEGRVPSDSGMTYEILSTACTNFTNVNLISLPAGIFGSGAREGIVLLSDHPSPKLDALYSSVKTGLRKIKTVSKKLEFLCYVLLNKTFLFRDSQGMSSLINTHFHDKISAGDNPCLLVSLEKFVEFGFGVCRHHAFLACYLISRLIQDRLIPVEEVHHVRGVVRNNSGHAWVMIKVKEGEWIHFDSLWNIIRPMDDEGYRFLCGRYTDSAIHGVFDKLGLARKADEYLSSTPVL